MDKRDRKTEKERETHTQKTSVYECAGPTATVPLCNIYNVVAFGDILRYKVNIKQNTKKIVLQLIRCRLVHLNETKLIYYFETITHKYTRKKRTENVEDEATN